MCGRFALLPERGVSAQDGGDVSNSFNALKANDLPNLPNYNICPTDQVCAVTSTDGVRHITAMRWGFIPHWYAKPDGGPLLINARGETIASKPAFGEAARQRRCLIPATGFYEWTKDGDGTRLPWYIHSARGAPLTFAGIWQRWERDGVAHTTCAIVTALANEKMATLHSRQPVTVEPKDYGLWLGEEGHGAATLMKAAPPEQLDFFRVDPAVNSNRAEGQGLIVPIQAASGCIHRSNPAGFVSHN